MNKLLELEKQFISEAQEILNKERRGEVKINDPKYREHLKRRAHGLCPICEADLQFNEAIINQNSVKYRFSCRHGHSMLHFENTITIRDSLRLRKYMSGIKKFIVEIISGWFPSISSKLPHGVEKSRKIDREKNEYHEVVKEYKTKKVIHECHESLSKHKK